ncbi:Glyceraldehyde-3-phosphate dehydrogenase testis-specific, partial [Dissostichus eleginoides]
CGCKKKRWAIGAGDSHCSSKKQQGELPVGDGVMRGSGGGSLLSGYGSTFGWSHRVVIVRLLATRGVETVCKPGDNLSVQGNARPRLVGRWCDVP